MIGWCKYRIERWFNRIVHQAIIDGIELYQKRLYGQSMPDDDQAKQQQQIALVTGWLVCLAIIFVLTAKAIGE